MIITRLCGGLGNQLFQYALGRQLALLHQTVLVLDCSAFASTNSRTFALNDFCIQAERITKVSEKLRFGRFLSKIGLQWPAHPVRYLHEPHFHFYSPVLQLPDNLYLSGYWQSEKYFINIASILRKDLTLRTEPSYAYKQWQPVIERTNAVSIHFRRGDYLIRSFSNRYLSPCPFDYYHQAIRYVSRFESEPVFFVFSDDISWAKLHFNIPFETYYVENCTDAEDIILQAACRLHIIANSTFSWWGAWLNPDPNKIVIAPQKWFSTERFNTQDLLPESWIRL